MSKHRTQRTHQTREHIFRAESVLRLLRDRTPHGTQEQTETRHVLELALSELRAALDETEYLLAPWAEQAAAIGGAQ